MLEDGQMDPIVIRLFHVHDLYSPMHLESFRGSLFVPLTRSGGASRLGSHAGPCRE